MISLGLAQIVNKEAGCSGFELNPNQSRDTKNEILSIKNKDQQQA